MDENQIIKKALFDLLDSMGALSNESELYGPALGLDDHDIANLKAGRQILLRDGKMTPAEIHEKAKAFAQSEIDSAYGGKPEPMYAGFASVVIKPARGPFVAYLKSQGIGDVRDWGGGGYQVSSNEIISRWPAAGPQYRQSMDIKEGAAAAYAKVLKEAGLNAYMTSRAD